MSSDDEIEEFSPWKGIPATIIYINICDPGKPNTAEVALAATCRLMRQYLRKSSSQYIAVCLYGLETSNTFGINTVEELFPLDLPTLDAYKSLQKVNIPSLKQSKELILSDVLWHSRKMFGSSKKQFLARNVMILSRFDVPPVQTDQKPAFKEAAHLSDSKIEVKLLNISETEYKIDEFYENFLKYDNICQGMDLSKPVWDVREIEELMYQQSSRHLAVARLAFEIGNGLSIGVGVYSLLKGTIHQKITALDSETHAILTTVNKTMKFKLGNDDDIGIDGEQEPKAVPILKSEILHYQEYGGERVEVTDSELKTIKNPFGPAKLKLLGFKPAHIMCKEKWIFKPCYFLFPNEELIEGSTIAFKALHQACSEMEMVGICILCTRVNSRPVTVALSPCKKPLGLNVDLGFDVIPIPFLEHMRNISAVEDEEDIKVEEANKSVMKDILCELKFDYEAGMFENPKQQSLYRAVEAIALKADEIEPFTDTTTPNLEKFENINDNLFYEVFGPFEVGGAKRAAQSSNGPRSKKVKSGDVDEDAVLQERLEKNQVNHYTVEQLKKILRSKEISDLPALTGLKKDDYVNLVYKHLK